MIPRSMLSRIDDPPRFLALILPDFGAANKGKRTSHKSIAISPSMHYTIFSYESESFFDF